MVSSFPNSEAMIMVVGISDHCPILVSINDRKRGWGRPFKFFDFWMNDDSFQDTLQDSWGQVVWVLKCTGYI